MNALDQVGRRERPIIQTMEPRVIPARARAECPRVDRDRTRGTALVGLPGMRFSAISVDFVSGDGKNAWESAEFINFPLP
jgi:hypothetical protein